MKTARKRKKKTLRSETKYPALRPELNLKTRQDELNDIKSYLPQLNEKEKAWMDKFVSEYVLGYFPKKNTKAYKKRLHKSKKAELSCYDKNNARWRCSLTQSKVQGKLDYGDVLDNCFKEIEENDEDDSKD